MELGRRKMRLGDMLVSRKLISREQLEQAIEEQRGSGKKLGEVLVEMNFVTEDRIVEALAQQFKMPIVSVANIPIPEEVLNLVDGTLLRKHYMMPYGFDPANPNILLVAMADPMDMLAIDDISIVTNLQIEPAITTTRDIVITLDKYYGDAAALQAADEYAKERKERMEEEETVNEDIENSPIVLLVKTMIEQAARQRASDIHVEALMNKVRVRYRIDGALYEKMSYDIHLLPAIIARIKVIGGMDISEKRKPQDGRITLVVDRREYDIRASVLPTVFGEKAVMRLALKNALNRDKKELGFNDEELTRFNHILANPNGIILVTGPTGSGKSTTLYTALSELNREDINIITVEDPVEANIDGINQVQVNPKADLTFASALRSILRQDPDVIMIGEIRDAETAGIAVQASITGHLVVSTLHTNSSAASITRLLDMGVESFLIADSVVGVIAQRLVRRLCPKCRKARPATVKEKEMMGVDPEKEQIIFEPAGCQECNQTGYFGRIGVYEILEVTKDLRRIIAEKGTTEQLRNQGLKDGMSTLRMSASRLVMDGTTSFSELLKVSFEE